MLQQTIIEIQKAENQAEQLIKESLEEAKIMSANAVVEAENIKKSTIEKTKEERNKVVLEAKKEAEQIYNNIIEEGKKQAKELAKKISFDKEIETIKNKVLEKYGNR